MTKEQKTYRLLIFLLVSWLIIIGLTRCETTYEEPFIEKGRTPELSLSYDFIPVSLTGPNEILGAYPYSMDPNALGSGQYPATESMTAANPLYLIKLDTITMTYTNLDRYTYMSSIKWTWNDGFDTETLHIPGDTLVPIDGGSKFQIRGQQLEGEFGFMLLSGSFSGCDPSLYDEHAPYETQTRKIALVGYTRELEPRKIGGDVVGLVRREDGNCTITGSVRPYPEIDRNVYHNPIEDWLQGKSNASSARNFVDSLYEKEFKTWK